MKTPAFSKAFLALLLASAAQIALAQTQPDPLYAALGETAGINKLADDFVNRLRVDPRLAPAFKDANPANLKRSLAQQFCKISGGPCVYEGADMKSAHADMEITKTDFNALVEVLQSSMDASGIAFSAQNRLLARLAPMHRDIITVK